MTDTNAVWFDSAESGHAQIEVDFFRLYDSPTPYLLTIAVLPSLHGSSGAFPQAHAVMDDFGTLRIIGSWA